MENKPTYPTSEVQKMRAPDINSPKTEPIPPTRVSVAEIEFSVFVYDTWGLQTWTRVILEQGFIPEFQRVHA